MSDDTSDAPPPTPCRCNRTRPVAMRSERRSIRRRQVVTAGLGWVILTQGTRPKELRAAIDSIRTNGAADEIVIVENGGTTADHGPDVRVVRSPTNLGIPGGRDLGVRSTSASIVGFLDDDAVLVSVDSGRRIVSAMEADPGLGVLSFRIVDESGSTQRRHVPRLGNRSADRSGPVATFLGGACAIRRDAYEQAGGYWPELFYAHEELDLAWRLYDSGYRAHYVADIVVEHPRAPISRHAEGWRLTGRNRVLVARRDLPWALVVPHTAIWIVIGIARAHGAPSRKAYVGGWVAGWRTTVPRRPIRWRTVTRIARSGRPPIV